MTDRSERWRDWLERLGPALVLFARQWAESHADAEDVVQDAFVRFWRHGRHRARDPRAYLFASVRRSALDRRRGDRRRRRREAAAARPEPMFDAAAGRAERREAVEAALCRLPTEQREVVVMKIWGGLTFRQIGAVLDVSPNTAASRYRYALAALRGALDSEEMT